MDEKAATSHVMSRKHVAVLFTVYFVVVVIYAALNAPHYDFVRITFWAMGYAFVTYVISGMFPFAVWGARGFKAAHAKSLFIPWAILAVVLIMTGE
jgi:hypothetical protein